MLCSKGAEDEKFQVLLNLYHMNPLKHSNIYKSHSDRMLSANKSSEVGAMNLDSNESTREKRKSVKMKLRDIEKQIHHVDSTKRRHFSQAKYNPGGKSAENFAVNNKIQYKPRPHASLETKDFADVERKGMGPNFDRIFSHIDSGENEKESTVAEVMSANDIEKSDSINNTPSQKTIVIDDDLLQENVSKNPILERYLKFNEISNFSESDVIVF